MEANKKKMLWIAVCIAVFCTLSLLNIFLVDRDFWFDEGFTGATVRLMQNTSINFAEYDVHPPGYYILMSWWMHIPHGDIVDHMWLRMLSVVAGALFLVFLGLFAYQEFSDRKAVSRALLLTAIGTTLLQYSTEARMYVVVMLLAVFACYAGIVAARRASVGWGVAGILAMTVLPFTHYFSCAVVPFIMAVWWVVFEERGYVRAWWPSLVAGVLAGLSALWVAVTYALPQTHRVGGLMLNLKTFSWMSVVSGWFFGFQFMGDQLTNVFVQVSIIVMVVAGVGFAGYKLLLQREKTREWRMELTFFSTMLVVPVGLVFGLFVAYHHRYVLVELWMLVFIVYYIILSRSKYKDEIFSILLAISIIFLVSWMRVFASDGEIVPEKVFQTMAQHIPCDDNVTIVHETTFSYMPALQYSYERNCSAKHILATQMDRKWATGVGADQLWLSGAEAWVNGTFNVTGQQYVYVNVLNDTLNVKNRSCTVWAGTGKLLEFGEIEWIDPEIDFNDTVCNKTFSGRMLR